MIEKQVSLALFGACKVQRGQTVLVGFSGGVDSLCLLHLLAEQPIRVIAAYFDHGLRPESARESDQCRQTAMALGCGFVSGQGDVKGIAASHHLSVEEAARTLRYAFLFETAEKLHADAVAVAHHADDQVETLLMHLMRGSGTTGLAGMRYRSTDPRGISLIPLIRPLLGSWRQEIRQYCDQKGLVPLEDQTNEEVTFYRNRIRMQLIPELETYNPQVKRHLWQTAALIADENEGMEASLQEEYAALVLGSGDHWVRLNRVALVQLPVWMQRRIIRRALFELKSSLRDIDFEMAERAREFLANPSRSQTCQVDANLEIFCLDEQSVALAWRSQPLPDLWPQVNFDHRPVSVPEARIVLPGGWVFTLGEAEPALEVVKKDPWTARLDAEALIEPLSIGTRRSGEVFEPFGMGRKKMKLGDFFTNVHLPTRAREHWPLVRSGDDVIWVPGFRIAEFCKVTAKTKRVVELELKKEKAGDVAG